MTIILVILAILGISVWRIADKFQEATNTKEEWKSSYGKIYKNLSYGSQENQLYDLYIPAGTSSDKPQSLILCVHGGGWSGGSRKEMDFACKRYAKAGYITATVEYSLLNADKPEITMETMVDEIGMCVTALKEELGRRGYAVDKIALFGGSAGGHLALLYAYSLANESAIPIAFVAVQSAPVGVDHGAEGISDEVVAAAKSASPIQFVDENTVPTLLCHGEKDVIVPYEGTMALIDKLKSYGIPYEFVNYPNSNHTLESDPESHAEYHKQMLAFCKTYFGY